MQYLASLSRPRGRKKPQICYLRLGAIKKKRFARIEQSWFLTWRFLSSPILEICIFFLPILSSGFGLSVTSSFVGGLPASFKLTSSDWGVVRCRSVKWTDSNNKVSSLNHKHVPATSLDTVKGRNAKLSTSSQDYNSYNSRVEKTARFRTYLLAKFDFKMILQETVLPSFSKRSFIAWNDVMAFTISDFRRRS